MAIEKHALYVPALKWKQGEHLALRPLTAAQRSHIQPIADLPDRPYNWEKTKYTKSWEKHIDDLTKATVTHWGIEHDIALDQIITDDDQLASGSGTPWEYLFASMWDAGVSAIPVLSNHASASEQAALIQIVKAYKRSRWLLRFRSAEHGDVPSPAQVQTWFSNAMVALGAKHKQVDAVIDLGHVAGDPKAIAASTALALQALVALGDWRQVVLLSGGFPMNLAGIQKGTKQISRNDWDLFKRVVVRAELKGVNLAFGDYGITHVDAFAEDPRKMVMSSNIRYAHWTQWQVLKGKNTRDYGFGPYKVLCQILVALPIYMQAPFSQGDANYDKVASDPTVGPGNASHWRRDATNHHIHVVLHQLANQPEF